MSRELVDIEFQPDHSLAILVSTPGAIAPGLYRWAREDAQPRKLCDIHAPSFFSFDRRFVIERERGATSRIRLYSPRDCALLASLEIEGRALDVDAFGNYVAAAVRLAEKQIAMQLFDMSGRLIASNAVGRNVEMGFAPDGRMLVNFDLSDVGLQAWRVPRMTNVLLPAWLLDGDVTFVPGSRFVKRYQDNTLAVVRWPIGNTLFSLPASRALRLRQLSMDGRYGVGHELIDGVEQLQWIDFKDRVRTVLAKGTIDNAAMSADLKQAAWSLRLNAGAGVHRVSVQRARAPDATLGSEWMEPDLAAVTPTPPETTSTAAPAAADSATTNVVASTPVATSLPAEPSAKPPKAPVRPVSE
ncbi:MAG: hypothetical protein ACRDAM_03420 [Casimicrobium sp.]